jgi:bla regulator protein BlaR1
MQKIISVILLLSLIVLFSGCDSGNDAIEKQPYEAKIAESDTDDNLETEVSTPAQNNTLIQNVDFSDCFNGTNGSAVFYNIEDDEYRFYNEKACEIQYSPCSTFKIITTLLGLENGVISDENSTMKYNGAQYPVESWNKNLTLKEAFHTSCVWYFRQVIDEVGQNAVQKMLTDLGYGNCDISEWNGSSINPLPDLNGFWLESSLEIAPKEQIQVLAKTFDGKTNASPDTISILKKVMLIEEKENTSLFGKTGTGKNNAWFVGFFEKESKRWYFAINLQDENHATGKNAQEITQAIINKYF